jgi:hypothetical protein
MEFFSLLRSKLGHLTETRIVLPKRAEPSVSRILAGLERELDRCPTLT